MALVCVTGCRECTGCMVCRETQDEPVCPLCGSTRCDYLYRRDGEIIGCEDCIRRESI